MRSVALVLLVACQSSSSTPAPAPKTEEAPAPVIVAPTREETDALVAQLALGKAVFADQCASCHGDAGQGTDDGPLVIGPGAFPLEPRAGAKRTETFRTAADVLAFAQKNMPKDDPGSLKPDEYIAVIAYEIHSNAVLHDNGVKLERPLDPTRARALVLHPDPRSPDGVRSVMR